MPKRVARETYNRQKARYYAKHRYGLPRHWTLDEDRAVLTRSIRDVDLAKKLQRSVQSIQIRRSRLRAAAPRSGE